MKAHIQKGDLCFIILARRWHHVRGVYGDVQPLHFCANPNCFVKFRVTPASGGHLPVQLASIHATDHVAQGEAIKSQAADGNKLVLSGAETAHLKKTSGRGDCCIAVY